MPSSFYEHMTLSMTSAVDFEKSVTRSHATLVLERHHLGARLACKVASAAMDVPAVVSARVDMNLAPAALEMHTPQLLSYSGGATSIKEGGGGVAEGGMMTVTCVAKGAKPEAYIYWNSEPPIDFGEPEEDVSAKIIV